MMKPRHFSMLGIFAAAASPLLAVTWTAASTPPRRHTKKSRAAKTAIQIDELLGRESHLSPDRHATACLTGRSILVSGAGGSIGSELCRQIARTHPARLILFDCCENGVYELQQELLCRYRGKLSLCVEIGSVQDKNRLDEVFSRHRPQVVFHAAAHKHVPLMEACPGEAVKNNIFGTWQIAQAADRHHAARFVLISTDKAVNPSSVMGATKRFGEMILQSMHASQTKFAAVRFGNVLGSNGSVVPLFLRQIEQGGPVTVTDRRMIRYFMTIPEAVQLVLRAGAMEGGSGVYVLDMGRPVRILELAERLITLSGHIPYKEIRIIETGLRPGEKLFEELLTESGPLSQSADHKIFIERRQDITPAEIERSLSLLRRAVEQGKPEQIRQALKKAVPSYCPNTKKKSRQQTILSVPMSERHSEMAGD